MGNISEVMYMDKVNNKCYTQKLNKDEYLIYETGEVREYTHGITRADNQNGLRKTFRHCRELINANVTDVKKVRWITLTYAENMTDTNKLYKDFRDFNKRFQRWLQKHGYQKAEYIVMMEPQGRGAWHAHLLYIWYEQSAPFIPNNELAQLWGHGFTKCKKLDDVDNVGAYLTAYLGDMELSEFEQNYDISAGDLHGPVLKQVEITDENGKKVSKSIIKGARLNLYPAGMNMIRHSAGIKKPSIEWITQERAKEKVKDSTLTYTTALLISDSAKGYENVVEKTYYNKARTGTT